MTERNTGLTAGPVVESVATGLALAAALVWFGSCLVGSFHPDGLARPYWPKMAGLRTDSAGVGAFALLVATVTLSETLRVCRRRRAAPVEVGERVPISPLAAMATGVAVATLVGGIGLVIYLSVNGLTHPATLAIHATHFATWPTEGTLRVIALAVTVLSAAWLRLVTILHPGAWIGS